MALPIPYEKNHREIDGQLEKRCNICEVWLPATLEYFYNNNKNKTDGLYPYCKKCAVHKIELKKQEDPETFKRKKCESNKKVYDSNPEKKQYQIDWANKQREEGYTREYLRNNPDKTREYGLKRANKDHIISKNEWIACKEYFNNSCAYCGLPIESHHYTRLGITKLGDFHKEHVDHEGARDLSNCVPSCGSCKSKKHTLELNEWYNKNNPVYSKVRYDKIMKWLNSDYLQYISID